MEVISSRVFEIERRLLSGYYGKLGGLSDVAFRRYILLNKAVRKYRRNASLPPFIVWSSLNDMRRRGGLLTHEVDVYNSATEELYDKHFIRARPELAKPNHPDMNEVLILPDYDGVQYTPIDLERTPQNMAALDRGYIQMPDKWFKSDYGNGSPFHNIVRDGHVREPTVLGAVIIKLYQYNNLVIYGGVDPKMLRKDQSGVFIYPSLYEELHISKKELEQHIEYLLSNEFMAWEPILAQITDVTGAEQIHYVRDGISSLYAARLKFQPSRQYDIWRNHYRDD